MMKKRGVKIVRSIFPALQAGRFFRGFNSLFFIFYFSCFSANSTVYTVNSLANTNTGAGTLGTLRYCITQANLSAGPHTINFSVAGTIPISSNAVVLPTLSQAITIDGTTAPGYAGTPVVLINGTGSTGINGMTISAANCRVYGLEIFNFPYRGLLINVDAADNFIIGASGKGNVIRNNGYYGVEIISADNGIFAYNKVGVNATGSTCAGNGYDGITITGNANSNSILNNHISCNGYNGLYIATSNNNIVKGNIFGPLSALCSNNGYRGIKIELTSANNIIGGTLTGEANKLSGNLYYGIEVVDVGSVGNRISGNSMSCNDYGAIELTSSGNANFASPVITAASGVTVSGTSVANAIIEVFRDQNTATCSFAPAANQGADYLGTTVATAGGTWSLAGTFSGWVVATARSAAGNSSRFSARVNTGVAGISINPCLGIIVLPVQLLRFDGTKRDDVVDLTWTTASETNNNYFTVERSLNGIEWTVVGNVNGKGNSSSVEHYLLTDSNVKNDVEYVYYRLKQTDFDGEIAYSSVIAVKLYANEEAIVFYPNPSSDFLTTDALIDNELEYAIYDITGKLMQTGILTSEDRKVNVVNLIKGIYFMKTGKYKVHTCKFIRE